MSEGRLNQMYGLCVLRNKDGVQIMQPVYQDEFGILELSRQPSDTSVDSLFDTQRSKALKLFLGRILLKLLHLFKIKFCSFSKISPQDPKVSV